GARRRVDLRGAASDPAGGRQAERRPGGRGGRAARRARGCAPAGREAPFRPVDRVVQPAILLRLSARAAFESPCNSTLGASRPDSYPIRFVSSEASGASRRLFYAVTSIRHRSLKTQQ